MPEQQTLAIEPAAPPAAPASTTPPPVRKFVLPAENVKTEVKAPPPAAAAEAVQNKAEQAPAGEPEAEKPEEAKEELTPEQAAKRQSNRYERRLGNAFRKAAEAEARAKLAEERLAAHVPAAQSETGAPKLEQFDFDPEKYAAAKAKFETEKALKENAAKQRGEAVKKNQEALVSAWEEKVEKASDKYDDFATVVGELQPSNALISAIMECDTGDVAYYLGKHPKEAQRIAELGPISQIREIGKLEAKLALQPEKPKTPSKAPEPIKPLSGAGSTASDVPSEKDDMGAWMKKRQKQVHGRR